MNLSKQDDKIDIPSDDSGPKLTINFKNLDNIMQDHKLNTNTYELQSQDNVASDYCIIFCTFLIITIFCLPFVICDLYFAYNDISCQHDSNPVGITLTTWLQTSGFVIISYLVLILILFLCSLNSDYNKVLLNIIKYIFSVFLFAWIIVGSVIFWKYLEPSGTCNKNVSDYMWARLIIGLIGIYVNSRQVNKK